ncbi:MAG: (Fe-S)-binding protein [Candidatus Helarchaeota archaeon]|nr:(Fe-S)-binding protein [Candidatus Helarchaeota archaeon]
MEILEKYDKIVYYCSHCRLCSIANYHELKDWVPICPSGSYYGFESYFAVGRVELIRGLIEGDVPTNAEDLLQIVYACQVCGGCFVQCKDHTALGAVQNQVETFEDLRTALVDSGVGPMPGHLEIKKDTLKNHNPYKEANEKRFDWLEGRKVSEKQEEIIYFAGCTASFREKEIAQATVDILNKLNVKFSILGVDEWCCGSPMLRSGMRKDAMEIIEHNYKTILDSGAKTVITSCAGCYKTLTIDYPKLLQKEKLDFKVVHSSQFFKKEFRNQGIKLKPQKVTITYHDPCHLSRHAAVRKDPRRVIGMIPEINFIEFQRNGKQAWCCGAGGGVKKAFADFALWTSKERIKEADDIEKLETIVSTCPFCKRNLKEAVDALGRSYNVLDLTELLLKSL